MTWRLVIPIVFILLSCQDSELPTAGLHNNEISLYDTFHLPLDTAKIISLLGIKTDDKVSNFDLFLDTLDTIEMVNAQFACDCQDWVTDQYWKTYNLGEFGYFIEPGNDEIELNKGIGGFRNKVRFIGKSSYDNDRKLNTRLSDTIRVFKYFAYEILLPAKVYGPQYYSGKTELPNSKEELIQRSVITLKN